MSSISTGEPCQQCKQPYYYRTVTREDGSTVERLHCDHDPAFHKHPPQRSEAKQISSSDLLPPRRSFGYDD